MKRLFLLAFLCLQATLMSADVVKGRVVDADSSEPLPDAKVQIYIKDVAAYGWYMFDLTTDSIGQVRWTVGTMSQVNITINYFGYEPLEKSFNCAGGTKDTLNIGDLKMKMSAELLDEVVVKAKAKQFVMRGDTIIFNPEAFNLDDGARVAELVRRLPGVSIKEGKLYFMDKEVHMKVNGHDVADDFLTGQLPAEAVQNIKAYEKKSELAELTGMNDGEEQQVLDIVIKPGFMDNWYGLTKLSAYASKNYRASANLNYLSDHNPINLYVRASDCGSKTTNVWEEGEIEDRSTPQSQQHGSFSYTHIWKPEYVKTSYEDSWNVQTSPNHNDTYQNSWQNTETFLNGKSSSFRNSHSYNYSHILDLPMSASAGIHLDSKTSLYVYVKGIATRNSSSSTNEQQTYQATEYSDNPQKLINSSRGESFSNNNSGNIDTRIMLDGSLNRAGYFISLITKNSKEKGTANSHTDYQYQELGTSQALDQSANTTSNLFQTIFDAKINYQLIPKKLKISAGYWMDYLRKADDSEHYQNGDYDFANSFDRMKRYLVNEPRIELQADLGELWMKGEVKMQNIDEHLDYKRGKLDTVVCRNTWFPRPAFEFQWKSSKTTQMGGGVSWHYRVADILDGTNYTDDTNPLNIVKGNPNLKASSNLSSNLSYSMMFPKGQQMLTFNVYYNHAFSPPSRVRAYDAKTGIYTTIAANVGDRQMLRTGISYDRVLGEFFRLRNRSNIEISANHDIKTLTSLDDPWEQFLENSTAVTEDLRFSFQNKGWEVSLNGRVMYNGINYSDKAIGVQNLWEYNVGMDGEYRIKYWTFNLSGTLVGNAGYLSDMMNRNRFALNADITWKVLKNKGQLTLSAQDILNQMDFVFFSNTPTVLTENRTETFHRYTAISFTYNFDAKVKKK